LAKKVEFFFDFGSPFSYIAYTQMPGLAERTGATVIYRPMLLGGVFKATGNATPMAVPAKGAYLGKDLDRVASHLGVPFRMNPFFLINTLLVMRGAVAAEAEGCFDTYVDALFRATWVDGKDTGDPAVVAGVLTDAGLDAERILARIGEQAIKDALKANTEEAVARGVFGAPTFFVGDEMFFGHDRIDYVEAALRPA